MHKTLFLLWGPFGDRADELAQEIGAKRVSITFLYGPRYFAPVRYLALFIKTLIILFSRRPDTVFAQNPPVFCPLTCLLYCRMTGAKLIIDHHSIWRVKTLGGGPLSRVIGILEGIVARASFANTAPHELWAEKLKEMGAQRVEVVHDFVPRNERNRDESLRSSLARERIIAISSHGGHPLEKMESEAAAVGGFPDLALLITGPTEKLRQRLPAADLPANVRYLGFLPKDAYETLKASADFALNITDEPYTLSHVLLEFAASSLPVVSSRQEAVEGFFGDSLLYTESTSAADVAKKVEEILTPSVRDDYRQRIATFYDGLSIKRTQEVELLRSLVS